MAKLDSEQQSLEAARTSMINVKNDLMNQRTNIQLSSEQMTQK